MTDKSSDMVGNLNPILARGDRHLNDLDINRSNGWGLSGMGAGGGGGDVNMWSSSVHDVSLTVSL